jgi:hypothetical protein
VFCQFKQAPGRHAAGVGLTAELLVLGMQFLDPPPGVRLTVAVVLVLSRRIEDFEVCCCVATLNGRPSPQILLRLLKVVVIVYVSARLRRSLGRPGSHILPPCAASPRLKLECFVPGKALMGTSRIGQYQHVASRLVLEEIVDPLLLHQSAHEIEIGLPVLHAVGPLAITAAQRILEIAEPAVTEDLLDDIRGSHVLENPAIGVAGQEPQPGDQRGLVLDEPAGETDVRKAADETVEVSLGAPRQPRPDRDLVPDQPIEIQILPFADQIDVELERLPQLLGPVHRIKQQHVVPRGSRDCKLAMLLCRHLRCLSACRPARPGLI